jgi:hypothetical protein
MVPVEPRFSRQIAQKCGKKLCSVVQRLTRRRQPAHTMGIATVDQRRAVDFTILAAP